MQKNTIMDKARKMGLQRNKKQQNHKNTPDKENYREYLRELSSRVLWIFGAFIVSAIIGFEFKEIIQGLLTLQLTDLNLANLPAVSDTQATVWITLYAGILGALPFIAYNTYRFLEPVIGTTTGHAIRTFIMSGFLAVAGVGYAFVVTIPAALHGVAQPGDSAAIYNITSDTFLHSVIRNSVALGILFQLPLAIVFIRDVQSITSAKIKWIRWALLPAGLVAVAASTQYLTMGRGLMSLALGALPVVILFVTGIVWARFATHKRVPVASIAESAPIEKEQTVPAKQVQQQYAPLAKTVAETEPLAAFPDTIFDAILDESEEEIPFDLPSAMASAPLQAPVQRPVAAPAPVAVRPVVQARPQPLTASFASTPSSFGAYTAPATPPVRPTRSLDRPPVTRSMPWSQATLTPAQKAQLVAMQARKKETLSQTVPFRMSSMPPRTSTVEGFLPA